MLKIIYTERFKHIIRTFKKSIKDKTAKRAEVLPVPNDYSHVTVNLQTEDSKTGCLSKQMGLP